MFSAQVSLLFLKLYLSSLSVTCLLLQSVDVHQSSSTCGGRWLHGADPSFSVIITPNVSSFLIVNMSWFCADLSCTASVEYLCNVTCSCSVSFFSPSELLSFQCQICQNPQYLGWGWRIQSSPQYDMLIYSFFLDTAQFSRQHFH